MSDTAPLPDTPAAAGSQPETGSQPEAGARPTADVVVFPATAALEAKRPTHDGLIWPIPRPEMQTAARVIERMAEDAAALVREHGDIEPIAEAHFVALGWLPGQVRLYGASAIRRMRSAARATFDRMAAGLHDQGEAFSSPSPLAGRGEAPGLDPGGRGEGSHRTQSMAFDPARNADNANEVA